jgi:hypothetical protein
MRWDFLVFPKGQKTQFEKGNSVVHDIKRPKVVLISGEA